MNIFVFDIETVPDTLSGKKVYQLDTDDNIELANVMFAKRKEKNGTDFLALHFQKIVAISIVFRFNDSIKVWSLGGEDSAEKELIERFYAGIDKYTPDLVSWNGNGFDLPVLHYRSLLHGVDASRYWEKGDADNSFKWNNYLSRYHHRHLDLMDVLAGYQARANAPLDEIAAMLGFPGKMGMSGSKVFESYFNNEVKAIRDYCETDVLNTYLVYLKFEIIRGNLSIDEFEKECLLLREYLESEQKPHFNEFLENWNS